MIEFNRKRDRHINGYIYVSDIELEEQGITKRPVDIVGTYILYNGEKAYVTGASNDGILFGQACIITDAMFYKFVEDFPVFNCPCGKHTVDPVHYNYCTHGLGRVYYQLKSVDLLAWFNKHDRQHLIV